MKSIFSDYYYYYCTHVLLNFVSADRADQYEHTLKKISNIPNKDKKPFFEKLGLEIKKEIDLYGITADRDLIIKTAEMVINAGKDKSLLIPKSEMLTLFSNYGATWPLFDKLPSYANIGVTYKYREYDDSKRVNIQVFQPEAIIFEDIAILYNLVLEDDENKKLSLKTNNALCRNITVSCFNLLECYINGKAAEFIYSSDRVLSEDEKSILTERKSDGKQRLLGLRDKFIKYPRIITNNTHHILDENNSKCFKFVFIDMKARRDSYVHLNYSDITKQKTLYSANEKTFTDDILNTIGLIKEIEMILFGNTEKLWYLTDITINKKIDREFFK